LLLLGSTGTCIAEAGRPLYYCCRYWACKGLRAMALAGMLNLAALAFTVAFSGFLLLGVNWPELLTAECIEQVGCILSGVALAESMPYLGCLL